MHECDCVLMPLQAKMHNKIPTCLIGVLFNQWKASHSDAHTKNVVEMVHTNILSILITSYISLSPYPLHIRSSFLKIKREAEQVI